MQNIKKVASGQWSQLVRKPSPDFLTFSHNLRGYTALLWRKRNIHCMCSQSTTNSSIQPITWHTPNENVRSNSNLKQMKCQSPRATRDTRVLLVTNNIHHWNAGVSQPPSQAEPCSRAHSQGHPALHSLAAAVWNTKAERLLVLPSSSTEMATACQSISHGNKSWRFSKTPPCTAILLCYYISSGKAKAEHNYTDINKVL